MIYIESRDGGKGLRLGFGTEGEMEDTEVEEGEAFSYQNDDAANIDIDLSYIDDKLQKVLGHFQKDFEGGVSAENLGAKFGGYGSFLPVHQRSPVSSHPRTPSKIHNHNTLTSPNNLHLEGGHHCSEIPSSTYLSGTHGPSSATSALLPTLRASVKESSKRDVGMPSAYCAEKSILRCEPVKNCAQPSDQKTLKVRIKVGSDNLLARNTSEISSGLGLDLSPSLSLDDSPINSEGFFHDPLDCPDESPTSILQIMTSFPVRGNLLLSPLPDDVLYLTEKGELPGESKARRMQKYGQEQSKGMDSERGDYKFLGGKKPKAVEKNAFAGELRNHNDKGNQMGSGVLLKKEMDIETSVCEELVAKALKLPLLSNPYSNVANSEKDTARAVDKSSLANKVKEERLCDLATGETLEAVCTQEIAFVAKPRGKAASAAKVLEDKEANFHSDMSVYPRKDGNYKGEKADVLTEAEPNVSKGTKARNAEPTDPVEQKAGKKAISHEYNDVQVAFGKEHSSSGGKAKKKSKGSQSHGVKGAEVPKDSTRIDSCLVSKNRKSTHANSHLSKNEVEDSKLQRDHGRARHIYSDLFGDIELELGDNDVVSAETLSTARPKHVEADDKSTFASNCTLKERSNCKKTEKPSISEAYFKSAANAAPITGSGPISVEGPGPANPAPITGNEPISGEGPVFQDDYWVQCDKCLKWRLLPLGTNPESLPEKWLCSMLYWLPGMNHCSISEDETMRARNQFPHGPPQFSNFMKKNLQASAKSRSLNGVNQSPPANEIESQFLSKYSVVEEHRNKQKEKNKLFEHHSDGGGEIVSSNIESMKETDRDCSRGSKKTKIDGIHRTEDWMNGQDGSAGKMGPSSSSGLSANALGKNQHKYDDRRSNARKCEANDSSPLKNPKDRGLVTSEDESPYRKKSDDNNVVRKRKMTERQDTHVYTTSSLSGSHLNGGRDFLEGTSENDHKKEKKARVSESEGKETSVSRGSHGAAKKVRRTKDQRFEPGQGSTQRSLDATNSLGRDSGPAQPSQAATSSSSKVSGSHKNKANLKEVKGSPVESVSSSPLRFSIPDKSTSTRSLEGKDDSGDACLFATRTPRRCSDGEYDKASDHSARAKKGEISANRNDKQYHTGVSHPRKSGKGSSSRSKDRNGNFQCELDSGRVSDSHNRSVDRSPYGEKSRAGKKRIRERFGISSNEVANDSVGKRESAGKLAGDNCKRENQSIFGGNAGSDVKVDALSSQDQKQNLRLDSDERSSKRFLSEKRDQVEVSGRGKSNPLPPSGRGQDETVTHSLHLDPGSQKENGANSMSVDTSKGDDALKAPKQIKRSEKKNGNQPIESSHTTTNGHEVRELDASSRVRRDSSNQGVTNAVKEAKDLKHLADRLKNSGSNAESTGLYLQAVLKFLHGASLLESSNSESAKQVEIIQAMQMYSSTAKLSEFCAREYEKSKDMAAAALAYKCVEVAYMRVVYSSHTSASRDRQELQTALQIVPPGESPSSSASDVDNLNNPTTLDKVSSAKGVSSPQVTGSHVIAARNRPNFVRLLNFAQDVTFAMEASRKSRIAFAAANTGRVEAKYREGLTSVKRALDFDFQDVEGLLRLVRLAMEAISR